MIAVSCNGCGMLLAEDGCPNRSCVSWSGLKAASIAAKNEVTFPACGDIDAGAVAVVCEHGRIKQHGTPCGHKRAR